MSIGLRPGYFGANYVGIQHNPFETEGDAFDPRRQRALSTVPTDDPDRNKRVATRLRKGFQALEKVIRPEMVTVYAYKAAVREPG